MAAPAFVSFLAARPRRRTNMDVSSFSSEMSETQILR